MSMRSTGGKRRVPRRGCWVLSQSRGKIRNWTRGKIHHILRL